MLNYQLPGFKALRPQPAINNLLHSHMRTAVVFIVLKNVSKFDYNKIAQKIAVHATTCGRFSAASFSSLYIRSKLIFPTRSS